MVADQKRLLTVASICTLNFCACDEHLAQSHSKIQDKELREQHISMS